MGEKTENEMIDYNEFPHLVKVLQEFAVEARNLYKQNLLVNDRKASGRLLNSVDYITEINGNTYEIFLTLEDYWKYVEEDTRPHFPPLDKILEWIRVKPILPRPFANGKLPTPETLAFLIGRAMAGLSPNQEKCKNPNGGTTGTHDLEKTMEVINDRFEKRIAEAFDEDLAYMVEAEIKLLVKPFSDSNKYV